LDIHFKLEIEMGSSFLTHSSFFLNNTDLRLWGNNAEAYDFMRLVLGFWDTPVPSAGATGQADFRR
jgi:hypothetical protein